MHFSGGMDPSSQDLALLESSFRVIPSQLPLALIREKQSKPRRPGPLCFAPSPTPESSNWATHAGVNFKVSLYPAHEKANTQALE